MSRVRASVVALVCTLCLTVVAAPAAAQAESLAGEQLLWGTFESTTFDCDPEGSTAVFTATGEAVGPYPGTYVETVTVTTGPMVVNRWVDQYGDPAMEASAQIATLRVEFTITSGETVITGTKELTSSESTWFYCKRQRSAECDAVSLAVSTENESLSYEAVINGRTDTGTADLTASFADALECGGYIDASNLGGLQETFTPSITPGYTYASVCTMAREFAETHAGARALCSTLEAAEASAARGDTEAARQQLKAFARQVRALTGRELTTAEAETLLAAAASLPGQ